mmetsp:Transcript_11168/g.25971  ORF Transcript_11168/g.25971 Transcript_11168/m.25971 type:complete len:253 (-) Transcript_11168:373-1131(-)
MAGCLFRCPGPMHSALETGAWELGDGSRYSRIQNVVIVFSVDLSLDARIPRTDHSLRFLLSSRVLVHPGCRLLRRYSYDLGIQSKVGYLGLYNAAGGTRKRGKVRGLERHRVTFGHLRTRQNGLDMGDLPRRLHRRIRGQRLRVPRGPDRTRGRRQDGAVRTEPRRVGRRRRDLAERFLRRDHQDLGGRRRRLVLRLFDTGHPQRHRLVAGGGSRGSAGGECFGRRKPGHHQELYAFGTEATLPRRRKQQNQ